MNRRKDLKKVADPGAEVSIRACHNDATQFPQDAPWAAERVHQDGAHYTHRWQTFGGDASVDPRSPR
jgi:hypothetical protein